MLLNALPTADSSERSRLLSVDLVRRRALERLYERRTAVEDLIRSLEHYQQSRKDNRAQCIEFSAAQRRPSGCSESQT